MSLFVLRGSTAIVIGSHYIGTLCVLNTTNDLSNSDYNARYATIWILGKINEVIKIQNLRPLGIMGRTITMHVFLLVLLIRKSIKEEHNLQHE